MSRLTSWLRALLAHPLTRGMALDDPRTTDLRRSIIQQNGFLRQIYEEWNVALASALPETVGPVLELGSGAGFLEEHIPSLITSEVFRCQTVDVILNGLQLPFADRTLRAIVMVDVLHHLPRPRAFFSEAARCVRAGGVVVMHEPWVTAWSRLVYGWLHHEPFEMEARYWEFPVSGPLSGANSALPWIIFERDRPLFEREFPEWQIGDIALSLPFRYLVSGGVSMRPLMPGWTFGFWRWLETLLAAQMKHIAMFATIRLVRAEDSDEHA